MIMLSSTKTGTIAVMIRISMLTRYERARGCMHADVHVEAWKRSLMFKAHATRPLLVITTNEAWFEETVTYCTCAN